MSIKREGSGAVPERAGEHTGAAFRYRRAIGVMSTFAVLAGTGCSANQATSQRQGNDNETAYMVESGTANLHAVEQGNAESKHVTIAVHGGPGLSLESLGDLESLAGEDRLLVRYDQRGTGKSSEPTDGDYSIQSQVADIEAVRIATGADKIDLIGRSWGGLLATAYAAENPDKVDDLVLMSAVPLDVEEYLAGQERFSDRVAALQDEGIVPAPLPEVVGNSCEERINAVLPAYMAEPTGEVPDGVGSCAADASQRSYEALMEPNVLQPYTQLARRYTGDVLVLAGDKDPFGTEWPRRIDTILAKGAVTNMILKDTGHFVTFERPQEALGSIDSFLD